jgi:hypothetical protein
MLVNEDKHAAAGVGCLVAIVTFSDWVDRTNNELSINLAYHLHTGEVILLKAAYGWLIRGGQKRAVDAVTRVRRTCCRCSMLERKREKIWKSLRD